MGKKWMAAGTAAKAGTVAKVKVIATALPTRLIAVAGLVSFALPLVTQALPEYADAIALWGGRVVVLIGAAVAIIRKVTPVADDQVGVLPQGPPASPIVVIDQAPPVGAGGQHG